MHMKCLLPHVRKVPYWVAVKGVAGEGRLIGEPKFYLSSKCTMTLTTIQICTTFSDLYITLVFSL